MHLNSNITEMITCSYHASIEMKPFETLYRGRCRSLVGWFEIGEMPLIGSDLILDVMEKVNLIREKLKSAISQKLAKVIFLMLGGETS